MRYLSDLLHNDEYYQISVEEKEFVIKLVDNSPLMSYLRNVVVDGHTKAEIYQKYVDTIDYLFKAYVEHGTRQHRQ